MYRETQVEHFEPLLVKSRPIIIACGVATAILIAIAWAMIGHNVVRVAISGGILITTTSAFVAGSSYRLRDLRTRRGRVLRNQPHAEGEISKLPPPETIRRRLWISSCASIAGVLGLMATTAVGLLAVSEPAVGEWSAVVSILTVVISALHFVAATYTRPLD
ncbi:MAG TPA: hypothetical protein VNP96_02755 [Solirubrobacterales bacterium]|nr:hypothetical protein [Solirubrobacterales bacterium]